MLEGGGKQVMPEEEPWVEVVVLQFEHGVQAFVGRVYSLNIGH